jgi:uncharacterized membrane protein
MSKSIDLSRPPILPAHLEQTVQSIAKLHAEHTRNATGLERFVGRLTARFAQSSFICVLTVITAVWIGGNLFALIAGYRPLDPPPFNWLQGAVGLLALYITALILTVQRRDDKLASHREQLTLELSIVAEQKIAKVIALLEEMRRDDPTLCNRHDPEAVAMSNTADPEAVLEAITQTHDDMIAVDASAKQETEDDTRKEPVK